MKTTRIIFVFVFLVFASAVWSQSIARWYTSMGDFEITLREDLMPITTQNFLDLTNDNFYDDLIFHRVIADFMIQDGCPYGTGTGGPGYTIPDEWNPLVNYNEPYVIGMANTGQPNSAGSQYFITVEPTTWLNGDYAAFGHVTMGTDIVENISNVPTTGPNGTPPDKPLTDVVIDSVRIMTAQFYGFNPVEDSLYVNAGDQLVFGMLTNDPDVTFSWYIDAEQQTASSFLFNTSLTANGWHEVTGIGTKNDYDYEKTWWVEVSGGTAVDDIIANQIFLYQNSPNPFNPETNIRFALNNSETVKLDIYNTNGQHVKSLINQELSRGVHNIIWNGTDDDQQSVSSGIYLYKLQAGEFSSMRKALLLK